MLGSELFIPSRLSRAGIVMVGGLVFAGLVLASSISPSHAQSELDILLAAEDALKSGAEKTEPKSGISISVDGEAVIGEPTNRDEIIRTDKALEAVDIQVKFDGLDITRRLNVSTSDIRRTYKPGEEITFVGSWNYPDWIERAEIRIFRQIDKYATEAIARPVQVLELPLGNSNTSSVKWQAPDQIDTLDPEADQLTYVLRVYDNFGRFDETLPLAIRISEQDVAIDDRIGSVPAVPGQSEDRTGISNIPLYGGSVTVYGRHIPAGYTVNVLGSEVEVDDGQRFVVSRILPPGDHVVDVGISGITKDQGLQFERDIYIPDSEWFLVGLADITVGRRLGADAESLSNTFPGEFSETFERGRLAFYLKGKIKGETLITAAFDTTEEELDEVFRNLDEKDPRQLLRNLDPNDFYPVYGDDSTIVEDAPTAGKFYVRVERGKSHVLWGNYKTRINGTELGRFERSLYGAQAIVRSEQSTAHGEPVAEVEAFAAEPGSLPQRDELRGTGGSAYFLRRQDINQGSEQITIEVRDRVTGQTIERTLLRPDEDYEIDYVQGVVLLRRPLQSTTGSDSSVSQTAIGGNDQFLVAVYEFTPTLTDLDGFTYGGRGEVWVNDRIRVGTTGFVENTGIADQTLYGADVLVRLSERSFLELEWAESEGDSFGAVTSTDGGFIFNPISGNNPTGGRSQAWRSQLAIDLEEISGGAAKGTVGGYYETRDAGFNSPGRYTLVDETLSGAFIDVEVTPDTSLRSKYDEIQRADGRDRREVSGEVIHRFDDQYTGSIGVTHSDEATAVGSSTGVGSRTDIGGRLTRTFDEGNSVWLFGQATVERSGTRDRNDRLGIGFERDLTDKISASAEVSYGTLGIGGLAALSYSPNADDRYYFGYRLDPDTTAGDLTGYDPFGRDYGSIVYGANRRINDQLTAFFEENYDFTGTQRSLTHTYGVSYTPDEVWTLAAGFEAGEVFDNVNGDFDRVAVSGSASLREQVRNASLRFEARFEDGVNASVRDRNTYLFSGSYGYLHNDDWRFIANVDAVVSDSDQSTFLDGDYIEGSVGWAYRPVADDTLNALFRYTYLEDLPGAQQVNVQNQLLGPRQRSHVLEADFIYDLNEKLSIGGKYGFRIGQVSADRSSDNFTDSSAHLGVVRADFHAVDKWDILLEARALWLEEVEQTNIGYLAGVYYHIGENVKFGVGYNFGRFSDDLTDLTFDDEGVFVNLIGKI
ncbi:MAG: TonB-dependent receptor [Pseudomonadota bacterium]